MIELLLLVLGILFICFFLTLGGPAPILGDRAPKNGNRGESKVSQILAKYCENKDAYVLNNITLRLEDGSTTQIDHVLVTTKGIFIIETKHYSGWIFANPRSKVWTQTIYHHKSKFQNPIFQNYKHVKAIQQFFNFLRSRIIHNIVVFTGEAIFKTPKPHNVFYIEELIPAIEQYSNDVLSLNHVQFCANRLEHVRLEQTRETDIEHRTYLTHKYNRW